ncbi:hypothetical protein C2845_PM10G14810 [Panicum miliaceum]|uniref:Uncharacterized protein n=1 Tax=Panicum miliaceum TaxID=4540 RepID=A0A3L6PDZ3_PANMI|nr:hypothetical protein C2845_PM10G14810 [Panicum miliaceum]
MMQHCTAAVSGDASGAFYCAAGAGAFAADGGASSRHQVVMDAEMLMGGDANHASMPFAPMTMSPYLPPPPFNYGSHHNQLAGYGYDIGDGCHDAAAAAAAYGKGGYHGTTTTCNFFW